MRRLRRAVAEGIRAQLPRRDWRGSQLIGSGGTFTNLAGIYLARQGILTARSVHAAHIPRADLEHILDMLAEMTPEERRQVPGLNPERADIIVAGIAVAAEVVRRIEARDIVVSRYGIREGLLLEAARVDTDDRRPGRSARALRERLRRCAATPSSRTRRTCASWPSCCSIRSASGSALERTIAPRSPTPRCCTTSAITSATSGITSTRTI